MEGDIPLNTSIFILEGKFSPTEGYGLVVGEPIIDCFIGIEMLVIEPKFFTIHLEGKL